MTITVSKELTFNDLYDEAWGQAIRTLEVIQENSMEDDFMNFVAEIWEEPISLIAINDLLAYDTDYVMKSLGIDPEEY